MPDISKLKDHFKENKLFFNRATTAIIIIFIFFLILISRAIYLQVLKHDVYYTLAKNNQVRMVPTTPPRGLIYDRNGKLIANNIPTFSLNIIPFQQKSLDNTIEELAKIIEISDDEKKLFYKRKKYKGKYEQIPIKTKLTEKEVAKFSVEKYRFQGVNIEASLTRNYKYKEPISHVIGYLGPISDNDLKTLDISKYRGLHQIGKTGIEKFYEKSLKGETGYKHVETNSRGLKLRTLDEKKSKSGKNIYLGIDIKLQKLAYKIMQGKRGAFVAIEPKTGEILALVSAPGFDPNLFVQGINIKSYNKLNKDPNKPLFNRAIKGQYPPGSTVKPIIALKALEDNIITKKYTIHDPGYYQINNEGRVFRDWNRHGHGKVNVEKAIAASCSTFFYHLSDKMGIEKIHSIFSTFNLGKKTNIDIYGEATGIAPSAAWKARVKNKPWFPGETLNVGIGQGYTTATPLQIATIAATIANRGVLVQPKLVKYMNDPTSTNQRVISKTNQSYIKLKNENNWNIVINGMKKTTKSVIGTGYKTFKDSPHLLVAGKTGTAQVFSLKENQVYNKDEIKTHLRDHYWFMGFAPIDNPKIAVAAIIENDSGAPAICRDIIEYYLMNMKHEKL